MRLKWQLEDCAATWNNGCNVLEVNSPVKYFSEEIHGECFISTLTYEEVITVFNMVSEKMAFDDLKDILSSRLIDQESISEYQTFLHTGNCSYLASLYHFRSNSLKLKLIKNGYVILDVYLIMDTGKWEIFKKKEFENMSEVYNFIRVY